mgnify:CR=1 FL=1
MLNTSVIRALALAAFCASGPLVAARQSPLDLQASVDRGERLELWQAANLVQDIDGRAAGYPELSLIPDASVSDAGASSEASPLPQFGSLMEGMPAGGESALKLSGSFDRQMLAGQKQEVQTRWADLWSRVLADGHSISICSIRNDLCSKAERRLLSILETSRKVEGRARLGWVNRAVNLAIRPVSDWAQYGYAQYWASPLQTLGSEAGDCKDYAIVKFAILRQLGIDQNDLRLVIVYDKLRQTEHEVVAVRHEQQWLILDNLTMAMLDARQISRYQPLFVMDYHGAREFTATVARR